MMCPFKYISGEVGVRRSEGCAVNKVLLAGVCLPPEDIICVTPLSEFQL